MDEKNKHEMSCLQTGFKPHPSVVWNQIKIRFLCDKSEWSESDLNQKSKLVSDSNQFSCL